MHIRNHGWRKFIFIILISALLIAEYGPTVVFAKKNSFSEEIIIEDLQLSDSRDQFALMEESQPGLNPETDSQKRMRRKPKRRRIRTCFCQLRRL